MRKKIFSAALGCGLLAVLALATAYAQMPSTTMRASIPFDFKIRGKTLPAGQYQIRRITDAPGGLMISNVNDTHELIMFETESASAPKTLRRSEVVFNRYGDTYFLSEVFEAGEGSGREVIPSRQERALRRETAGRGIEPETVAVAAY